MSSVAKWMSIEETAAELGLPIEVIAEAVQTGELPTLRLGSHTRISRETLQQLISAPGVAASPFPPTTVVALPKAELAPERIAKSGLAEPTLLTWVQDLAPTDPFSHGWPQLGGGKNEENYPQAWRAQIRLPGEQFGVRIGECVRHDRGRLTVFFAHMPIAEFVETLDGKHWAGLIKPDGKKVLPIDGEVPPLYRGTNLEPYREVTGMAGSGVPKGLAVIVERNDLRSVVHHAAARWLARHGHPVFPKV